MDELIELLPLYAELQGHPKLEIVKHYARACVAHATTAQAAEIEALRVKVVKLWNLRADAIHECTLVNARAERLAEALWGIEKELGSELVVVSGGRAYLPEQTFRKALHDVRAALLPTAAQDGK